MQAVYKRAPLNSKSPRVIFSVSERAIELLDKNFKNLNTDIIKL